MRSSVAASYVVHRTHRAAARLRAGSEVAECHAVDDLRDRLADLLPQLTELVRLVAVPPAGPPARLERRLRTLDGTQDVSHADLLGRSRQVVASRGTPLRAKQPGALQRQQDVLQIALRDRLPDSDVLDRDEPVPTAERQIQHRLDRVLALRRDPHRSARRPGLRSPRAAAGLTEPQTRLGRRGHDHRLASHGGAPAPRRAAARTTLHRLASHGGAPAPRPAAARTSWHCRAPGPAPPRAPSRWPPP